MEFEGKVVLITGAASGLGKSSALKFAGKGATLSLTDLNGEWLAETADKCASLLSDKSKVLTTVGDLTDTAVREKFVENSINTFGKIDVLLNVAGIWKRDTVLDGTGLETFDKVMSLNVRAPFHLSSLVAHHLIKTKGCIINVSSCASSIASGGNTSYGMSKAAVDALTKNSAYDLGKYGVRVNSINPGFVRTNIGSEPGQTTSSEYFDKLKGYHLLDRVPEASEVAEVIAFMVSAPNFTGTNLLYDGGVSLSRKTL